MAEARPERIDLLLWRHADAENGIPDAGRALTKKGLNQAKRVAAWLKPHLPGDCMILVSPAVRAQQTAATLDLPFNTEKRIGVGASAADIIAAAGWPKHGRTVIVVGHQPTLGQVAAQLLTGDPAGWTIKKGALWWFTYRDGETGLRAVVSPDLL